MGLNSTATHCYRIERYANLMALTVTYAKRCWLLASKVGMYRSVLAIAMQIALIDHGGYYKAGPNK